VSWLPQLVMCALLSTAGVRSAGAADESPMIRGTVPSADGVAIAYTAQGEGDTALVFIHGGFADQSFWDHQAASFAGRYRVVTLDLAGHGASGADREAWTLAAFGDDVLAVVEGLDLRRVVLLGNSMGGPVALEAARRMPERVIALIGVDTFHDGGARIEPEQWRARIDALGDDFAGTCRQMVKALFHEDVRPELVADVERQMCDPARAVAVRALEAFEGYDMGAAMKAVRVPIRSLNGDLYPTNVEGNRRFAPGFEAIVFEHTGHYPMLERPEEFNRALADLLDRLVPPAGP
jgi:pimeloyl-ACP methyl ester carboxylesterase